MSTRAERRLREAQDALAATTTAHEAAADALSALEARAVAGEDVDPLELAGAQGDVGIKDKRVQRDQAAVDAEQATVDEERARARHKELVEAAQATQVDLGTAEFRAGVVDLLRRAYAASDAWSKVQAAVRAEHGEIPFTGPGNQAPNGVQATGAVKLDGTAYRGRDVYSLVRDLKESVDQAFEDVRGERARSRSGGELPTSWQAKAIAAGVQAQRDDEQRGKPAVSTAA